MLGEDTFRPCRRSRHLLSEIAPDESRTFALRWRSISPFCYDARALRELADVAGGTSDAVDVLCTPSGCR